MDVVVLALRNVDHESTVNPKMQQIQALTLLKDREKSGYGIRKIVLKLDILLLGYYTRFSCSLIK